MVLLATNKVSYKIKPPAVDPVKEAGLVTTKHINNYSTQKFEKSWKWAKFYSQKYKSRLWRLWESENKTSEYWIFFFVG